MSHIRSYWLNLPKEDQVSGPTICVHLFDNFLEFRLGQFVTQWPHGGVKVVGADGAVSILVKLREGLLKLWTSKGTVASEGMKNKVEAQ